VRAALIARRSVRLEQVTPWIFGRGADQPLGGRGGRARVDFELGLREHRQQLLVFGCDRERRLDERNRLRVTVDLDQRESARDGMFGGEGVGGHRGGIDRRARGLDSRLSGSGAGPRS
jgi:hypothetical protein